MGVPERVVAKAFQMAARLAVADGLDAVALLDSKGKPIAIAGDLDEHTARSLAAFAASHAQVPHLLAGLQDGDLLDTSLVAEATDRRAGRARGARGRRQRAARSELTAATRAPDRRGSRAPSRVSGPSYAE